MVQKDTFVIGITGGSGSGKTSFVNQLELKYGQENICFISQDMYYKEREEQKMDAQGVINFDLPEGIYRKEFYQDIQKLLNGEVVKKTEYTFNNDNASASELTYNPRKILIIEGLFVLHFTEIMDLMDLRVFIQAQDDLKIIRRINRDKQERNYPLDDVLYRYQHHVSPSFNKYIKPYKEKADVIINNNDHFNNGLMLVECLIDKLLKSK